MGNENNPSNVTEPSQGDDPSNPQPNVGNSSSQGDTSTSIEALKQKIAELERDNKKYRNERKQQDAAIQAAEQVRLAEQGQFKQLAEQHEARVKELEPLAQSYAALADQLGKQVEGQMKDWPAEVKAFYPGSDAPIEQRLAWLEKSRALVEKLQQARSTPGNAPNPKPAGNTPEDLRKQYEKRLRSSGSYFKI